MPRLKGYRERLPLNVYDAFSPRELLMIGSGVKWSKASAGPVRLFGNKNIGSPELTNTQVAGQMCADQTAVITNWYARANIPPDITGAFEAWTHVTTVTFTIGAIARTVLPLSELLLRRDGRTNIKEDAHVHRDGTMIDDPWPREAYEAYRGTQLSMTSSLLPAWDDLTDAQKLGWGAVRGLHREHLPRPLIIPVRQNYGVTIESESRALSALIEVMPNVAPRALVWVHLEGLLCRDVA